MGDEDICARCKYFALRDLTNEQRATGRAECAGYETPTTWDERRRPCVLYGRPQDMQERRRREVYIKDMEAKHAATDTAVDAAP